MASGARRRLKRVGLWMSLLLVSINAGAYWAAWAACRMGSRPPRDSLRRLGLDRRFTRGTPALSGLRHERHVFPSRDGTSLEAWLIPHAQRRAVVVMFHGYGGSKGDLLREARAFHTMELDVFLVDFRGSGGSGGNETSIGFHEAQDVHAAVAYTRSLPGRPRAIAYGISMGAAAVMKADAEGGLGANALILECPFDRLLTTVSHRFEERRLPAFPLAPLLVFWGGWRQGFDGFSHNPAEYARRVRTPTLLLSGADDTMVTTAEAQAIAGALAGQRRFVSCPGVGHAPCLRGQPRLWRESVTGFLDTVLAHEATSSPRASNENTRATARTSWDLQAVSAVPGR